MDLRDVPAVELVKEKRFVVMALPTSTLEEAMRTMTETGVTSLPVFAPVRSSLDPSSPTLAQDSGYLGFISFFDVMAYVAFFTHFRDATAASAPPVPPPSPSFLLSPFLRVGREFAQRGHFALQIEEIVGYSRCAPS